MFGLTQDESGKSYVIGLDEVGRGALAGPICACACAIDLGIATDTNPIVSPMAINDSKKMSAMQREKAAEWLKNQARIHFYIESISAEHIDAYGIQTANQKVLTQALKQALEKTSEDAKIFIDYFQLSGYDTISVPKADTRFFSVAAASIVAKVHRDHLMVAYAQKFPHYGWHSNVGYGTLKHRQAIKEYGLTVLHRKSFTSAYSKQP